MLRLRISLQLIRGEPRPYITIYKYRHCVFHRCVLRYLLAGVWYAVLWETENNRRWEGGVHVYSTEEGSWDIGERLGRW